MYNQVLCEVVDPTHENKGYINTVWREELTTVLSKIVHRLTDLTRWALATFITGTDLLCWSDIVDYPCPFRQWDMNQSSRNNSNE